MVGSVRICGLPWKSTSAAAGAAPPYLTAPVTSSSCTEMKGCSKCRWALASVCSTGWRRRICLVAGEVFLGRWLRPQRQSWLRAASRWLDLRCSASLDSVRSTPNLEPGFPRICWSLFQPMGRRFTQQVARSSTTKHTFRQLPPGNVTTGICPLRPLHEKVSERLISACADNNRQAFAREISA
jgi:hypothetical protein